jgi:hypothetical protein
MRLVQVLPQRVLRVATKKTCGSKEEIRNVVKIIRIDSAINLG